MEILFAVWAFLVGLSLGCERKERSNTGMDVAKIIEELKDELREEQGKSWK